jgi:hypothetical protein
VARGLTHAYVRFPAPDTNVNNATFGVVPKTEQNPSRSLQMALKFISNQAKTLSRKARQEGQENNF